MASAQSTNPFLLQEREPLPAGDRRFDPKTFRSWVEDLPKGNLGLTSRELYNILRKLNRAEIPVADRMRNLDQLLESLMFVLDGLAASYIREPLPLSDSNRNRSRLTNALYVLIIQAYKIVLDQYHAQSSASQMLRRSNRMAAAHHLLYFLGRYLLYAYQLYQSPPEYIWKEIHSIYKYAVDHKLHDKPVNNVDSRLVAQSTTTDLYIQTLLLSVAGPYRLLQGEVMSVYMALKQWVAKCELLELNAKVGDEEHFYIINILADAPTHYRGAIDDDKIKKGWLLSTAGLAKQLAIELEAVQSSNSEQAIIRPQGGLDVVSMDLLARLMLTWGVGVKRSDKRNVSTGEVSIIFGLDALYHHMGGEPVKEYVAENSSQKASYEQDLSVDNVIMVEGEKARLEIDEFLIDGGPDLSQYGKEEDEESWDEELSTGKGLIIDDTPETEDVPVSRCAIYNESSYGYHLYLSGTDAHQVKVGELVGVQKDFADTAKGGVSLGVIRWMMSEQKGMLNFGVELLGGDAVPVMLHRMGKGEIIEDLKALFLTHRKVEITLITPPFFLEADEQLYLDQDGKVKSVILNQSLERTASFTQFVFTGASSRSSGTDPDTDDKNNQDADYEALWKNLT